METTLEQYLSTKELMALLGISRSTIYRLLEEDHRSFAHGKPGGMSASISPSKMTRIGWST